MATGLSIGFRLRRCAVAAFFLYLPAGCHSFQHSPFYCLKKTTDGAVQKASPAVDVGGLVLRPGPVAITADGLTLRRALVLAGQSPAAGAAFDGGSTTMLGDVNAYVADAKSSGKVAQMLEYARNRRIPGLVVKEWDDQLQSLDRRLENMQNSIPGKISESLEDLQNAAQKAGIAQCRLDQYEIHPELQALDRSSSAEETTKLATATKQVAEILAEFGETAGTAPTFAPPPTFRLVALTRQMTNSSATFYFPYDAAITGTIGEVILADIDLVQVLDFRQTSLATSIASSDISAYTIQGFVNDPGPRSIAGSIPITLVLNQDRATIVSPDSVALIERETVAGMEAYLLPVAAAQTGVLSTFQVRGGDAVTLTAMNLVPIVTHGIVSKALGAANGELGGNRAAKPGTPFCGKLHEQHREHVNQSIQNGGDLNAQVLRSFQDTYDTMNTRLGGIRAVR